jgi:PPP family 3-phenylpropionic acid transporter
MRPYDEEYDLLKTRETVRRLRASVVLDGESALLRSLYYVIYGSGAAWFPFLSMYLRQIGLSGLQIGTLSGVSPAVMVFGQPLWGVIADLWGRRRTLLLAMPLTALTILGFAWREGFWFLLGWSVLYTLVSNPIFTLADSLTLDYLEREPRLSYGRLRMWGAVGWAMVSYVAGRVIAGRDLRLMFVIGSLLMLSGWFLVLCTSRAVRGAAGQLGQNWRDLGIVLRNRRFLVFLVLVALVRVGSSSLFTFFSIYMDELGASRELIGLAIGVQGLSELPMYLVSAAIVRRIGPARTLAVAFLLYATRAFLYSVISQPLLVVAVQLMHGSFSLFLVAAVEYVNRLVPRAWRATGQSLLWAANMGAGGIVGSLLSGYLYDQVGAQGLYRWNSYLILGVALMAVWALRESTQD